jgi:hypothetical protein
MNQEFPKIINCRIPKTIKPGWMPKIEIFVLLNAPEHLKHQSLFFVSTQIPSQIWLLSAKTTKNKKVFRQQKPQEIRFVM